MPSSASERRVLETYPDLQRVLAANFASALGDRIQQVALAALVMGLGGSLGTIGALQVVSTVPYILFGLVAGALVDRWSRQRALIGSDLARMVLVGLVPLLLPLGLWPVFGVLFGVTCATLVFRPAMRSLPPELVASDHLVQANSTLETGQNLADLLGYPLAATVVAVLVGVLGPVAGPGAAFGINAASYLVSALLLRPVAALRQPAPRAPAQSLTDDILVGTRFLWQQPLVRANTLLFLAAPLLLGAMHTLWVGFAWKVSGTGAWGYGLTETAMGVGTVASLRLVPVVSARLPKGPIILAGLGMMAGSALLLGLVGSIFVAAALAFLSGVGNMLLLVPSLTLVQQQTPAGLRGRVFGIRSTLTFTGYALSNGVAGWIADAAGVQPTLLTMGLVALAVTAAAALVPSIRRAD